jgi:hypothetical protein
MPHTRIGPIMNPFRCRFGVFDQPIYYGLESAKPPKYRPDCRQSR